MIFWWKEERGEIRAITATQNSIHQEVKVCSFWEMEILSKLKPFRRLITWLQNGGYLTSTYQFGSRKISVSVSMSG
jgi:hypothetical protein